MNVITTDDVDLAPPAVLRAWWESWPAPTSDEGRDLVERLAIRAEALGMIENINGAGRLRG